MGHHGADRRRIRHRRRAVPDRALRLRHHRRHNMPPEYKQSHRREAEPVPILDVLGQAADPGRQGAQDLGGVLGHRAVQGQAVAVFQRVGRQHPGAGLAGGRRGARQALPAGRGPGAAQPGPAGRQNIIWHTTNQEPIQQLTSGAVPLATAFNGRVILANRAGAQLGYNPAYSAVSGNPYCVSKSLGPQAARPCELLNFMLTDAKGDAAYIEADQLRHAEHRRAGPGAASRAGPRCPPARRCRTRCSSRTTPGGPRTSPTPPQTFKEWQLAG